jgi:hypothetical protein
MPANKPAPRRARNEVLSLNVLAGKASENPEQLSQFGVLMRHFLDRFFGNEFASADGDAKTRLVQVACALGIPGLAVSMYLYPLYHLPRGHGRLSNYWGPRSYWAQAGDHCFFVLYTMVAMGVVAIFEWDLLFPDLLDVFVLSSLPVKAVRLLLARVTAILLLIAAAILASSFLPPLVLPAATDPPNLFRFLAAHCTAVACSGIFSATLTLTVEAMLLASLGDRWFRRISLWIQGLAVVALLSCLFLYPVVFGALRDAILSGNKWALWLPPFWFLGIYQRILGGAEVPPVFTSLARLGWLATGTTVLLAAALYPLAWWRRTAGLLTGAAKRACLLRASAPLHHALHATLVRLPFARAVWHFIGQNLLRVPRYRMVLVLYGGGGMSLMLAAVLRIVIEHGRITLAFPRGGLRAIVPIAAFWTVSGLRSTFLAPADQRGRWIFRAVQGQPAWPHIQAARRWVLLCAILGTLSLAAVAGAAQSVHPWRSVFAQGFVAVSLSFLLTDAFFLSVKIIPFTGSKSSSATNLALLMIPYLGFFPVIVLLTVAVEPWLETSLWHLGSAAVAVSAAHLCLLRSHQTRIREQLLQIEADENEEDFPLRLGLRY